MEDSENLQNNVDLIKLIKEYNSVAASYIEQQDFEEALDTLYQTRDLLTILQDKNDVIDKSYWVEMFHNSALCNQRLGKLEDTVVCLEECLYFLKDKTPWEVKCHKHFLNTSKDYLEKITKSKYKCKVNIQLCAILSQLKRHESALIHAKKAYDRAMRSVSYCYEICKDHLSLNKRLIGYSKLKSHHSQYKLLESPHYIYFTNLVCFAYPVIKSLMGIFNQHNTPDNLKKNHLGNYITEWLIGFQIGDMMIIDYLDFNELKSRTGIDDEISTDLLLEKICFLTISSYCIGTEIRMLSNQKFSKHTLEDSKQHYLRSVNFASFLPTCSLLYSHIMITYTKFFGHREIEKKVFKVEKEKRSKGKSKSPEIERIYRPSSLKALKKISPIKKGRGSDKVELQKRTIQEEVVIGDRVTFDGAALLRSEPDPEASFE